MNLLLVFLLIFNASQPLFHCRGSASAVKAKTMSGRGFAARATATPKPADCRWNGRTRKTSPGMFSFPARANPVRSSGRTKSS